MTSLESAVEVLKALHDLYDVDNSANKKEITRFLERFQRKHEAWATADYILKNDNSNVQAYLFAAQTLKIKIVSDLIDLDATARLQLRDSLLGFLCTRVGEIRAVRIQLCLALADLAIQMLDWKTVIPDLTEAFGRSREKVTLLLEILKVLSEEMESNSRIPLSNEEYKARAKELIDDNAEEVLQLLNSYMQTSGDDIELQEQIFRCLDSWIYTGSIDIKSIVASPLFRFAFEGLGSEELFEVCSDVIVEIIRETRDVNEYKEVIEQIYPLFGPMLNKLRIAIGDDNDEAVAGYCRIFTEAGDAYVTLIALHPEAFGVLLDGIGECAAYKDFEVVEMTFKFWYELTNTLISEKYQAAIPRLAPYFDTLVDIMLKHLQYPPEENVMTAEDRDEFRDFRHHMGDTLKDCCRILTPQRCLAKPLHLVTNLLAQPNATWQQIEAPIFSLRSMGSEVPSDENDVMPAIMEMLSKLPDHPKIRYAAILVISRYSFWTKYHPQYITYQLNFISSGFQDPEVAAASALALKYLCKDCSKQLVEYISQLQVFYVNIIRTLDYPDDNEVTEAISHVLAQLPVSEIQNALQIFCLPVVQQLHELVTKAQSGVSVTDDVKSYVKIGDTAVLISIFFKVIQPEVPLGQPHPCINFINELWPVFDLTLTQFGGVNTICEPLCKCFVEMIRSYRQHLLPLVPQIMERMVKAFEATGHGVYVWVAQKLVVNFIQQQEMTGLCWELVKKMSEILFIKLQTVPLDSISAAIGDYFKLITCILKDRPELLLQDPVLLSTVFRAGLAGLPMKDNVSLLDTIAFFRELVDNHLLVDIVLGLFKEFGGNLMSLLMNGMLSYFSSEVTDDSMRLVISLSKSLPNESIQWMASVMDQVPMDYTSIEKKSEFMNKWAAAIHEQQFSKLKSSLSRFIALNERDA